MEAPEKQPTEKHTERRTERPAERQTERRKEQCSDALKRWKTPMTYRIYRAKICFSMSILDRGPKSIILFYYFILVL